MTKEIDYVELLKLAHEKLGSQSDMIAELGLKVCALDLTKGHLTQCEAALESRDELNETLNDKITKLSEEKVYDYIEASTYATSLFNNHYKSKSDAVPLELCDTTRGIVTQIDNMVTGVIAELEKEREELIKEFAEAECMGDLAKITRQYGYEALKEQE